MRLKDETDHPVAEAGKFVVVFGENILTLEEKLALARPVQGAQDMEEGGLPGPGGADDGHQLPRAEPQVDAGQHLEAFLAAVFLVYALGCEERRRLLHGLSLVAEGNSWVNPGRLPGGIEGRGKGDEDGGHRDADHIGGEDQDRQGGDGIDLR